DPGRPVLGEHVFQAGADGIAVAMAVIEREADRETAKRQGLAVVGVGVAALDVQQSRTPGEADAARHRAERGPCVGVNESAGEDDAAIVAAEPAVLPLDTDQQIRGELVIGAGLQAAERSAIMVVAGDKTVENFVAAEGAGDVTADVEAGPVVDWHRGIGRSLAVGASPGIGRKY